MRHLFCFILIIVIGGTAHATSLRIVSLAPALTEIIATLNLTANLVGISSDSDYPESVKGITPVGAFLQPSFERIAGVRPTLILGMGQPNGPAFRQLQANGTRVVLFNSPDQITDIYSIIRQIGDLTNRQARAGQVIRSLKSQMAEIEKNRPTVSPTVMVVIWHPPITVAAANTFIGDMVKRAGGSNSIEGSRIRYPQMERELMMYK
ncbi:hypothetical protein EBR57_07165, partial [bacterium]|nr:hypothetical protein [bacterium]